MVSRRGSGGWSTGLRSRASKPTRRRRSGLKRSFADDSIGNVYDYLPDEPEG
jgi:hypothetical protein